MTIITAALLGLLTVLVLCVAKVAQDRADNLEALNSDLRDQLAEVCYQLDDARRAADRLRHTNDALIAENSTLLVDLMHTDQRNAYLESLHMARKGETASVKLLQGRTNTQTKMRLWKVSDA